MLIAYSLQLQIDQYFWITASMVIYISSITRLYFCQLQVDGWLNNKNIY